MKIGYLRGLRVPMMFLFMVFGFLSFSEVVAQKSVARLWNEATLEAIRHDFARPTVHARNLFHISAAMYDAWAAFDPSAETYFLGRTNGGLTCSFEGMPVPADRKAAQEEAMSYAAYRLLRHRYMFSPEGELSLAQFDSLMLVLGYDKDFTLTDYTSGSAAALGNYIAACVINFGYQDHSNEKADYASSVYSPVNSFLSPAKPGSQGMENPNHWQPLSFDFFIDQAGFEIPGGIPSFLSPEWGKVIPFALSPDELTLYERNGEEYWVYHDPGAPAYLEPDGGGNSASYKWNHSLVAIWSSQLDPANSPMIDISPNALGNLNMDSFPKDLAGLEDFYNLEEGGDPGRGYALNPYTQAPYESQIVPKGDYTRVLAEFWADGPDSETPPGHWFTILNYVKDQPLFEKKFKGEGAELDDLEWDIKAYFTLSGAMHDAAVAVWGIKGWYDYTRPLSAIRYMADKGQSTDPALPHFSPEGIPLKEGYIELVEAGDSLAGENNEHLGKVKLYAWRGPNYIPDPETSVAGVGWILAENWWPYQRPTFVTPPFAGYISGHSTFSRTAAEVLTLLTGDEYFPGGMGEFKALKNDFLVFEEGPSTDITLQWAKYYDAADQCSLSRIWGGIHPPVDDIPGRLIGKKIGQHAFSFAEQFFGSPATSTNEQVADVLKVSASPNPLGQGEALNLKIDQLSGENVFWELIDLQGVRRKSGQLAAPMGTVSVSLDAIPAGFYWLSLNNGKNTGVVKVMVQ